MERLHFTLIELQEREGMSRVHIALLLGLFGLAAGVRADTIYVSGTITQDLADSGGVAINNPSLNNINDGDSFTVTLAFLGSITGPQMTNLTSAVFVDNTAAASEDGFISAEVNIIAAAPEDQFEVLGCLLDPVSCTQGNELDLNFQIAATGLNQFGVGAEDIPDLSPSLDLLEDGGNSEIQGAVNSYSYQAAAAPVPEPSTFGLLLIAMAAVGVRGRISRKISFGGKS
jgi:PEP-CTERM motif